jgi:hypothetical protein
VPSSLLSGSEGVDLPLSTPGPPPLRFIITATHARSSLGGSTGSSGAALEMSALVATLLLRSREGKGKTGAGTGRTFLQRASSLGVSR